MEGLGVMAYAAEVSPAQGGAAGLWLGEGGYGDERKENGWVKENDGGEALPGGQIWSAEIQFKTKLDGEIVRTKSQKLV